MKIREWLNTLSDEEMGEVLADEEHNQNRLWADWLKEEMNPLKPIEKAYQLWLDAGRLVDFDVADKHENSRWAIWTWNDKQNQRLAVSWNFNDLRGHKPFEPSEIEVELELFRETARIMGWL